MTTTRHLPADERRALTVDTVIDLAAEQNPSEITTAAIAARMRLTQGALFRHFPTKDAIWQAVMEWVGDRLLASTRAAADAAATPLAALEAMFAAHVDFIARHPGVPRMMFGELQRASDTPAKRLARTLIARHAEHLQAVIEAGRACGEIRADTDAAAAATLLIGTVQGLVMQSLLADDIATIREQAPGAFAIYRRGIAGAA
ncbi:MAG TPA: TetR/AcrR family transcriptional regulator [Rhodocyclaceae bacterium]|nr:TetR/AcrR family transcriptional regulator [Rhodocyclaceae bacterium]